MIARILYVLVIAMIVALSILGGALEILEPLQ
jgi:hypothetical protein